MDKNAEKLKQRDWALAALEAFAIGGIQAVKIDQLAKKLGVSRGSFYWHFKDRADLFIALLDIYESEFTHALIDKVKNLPTARQRLTALIHEAAKQELMGVDNGRAEIAFRQWAFQENAVSRRMEIVDRLRLAYIEGELRQMGFSEQRRALVAKSIYITLLGLYFARGHGAVAADDAYLLTIDLLLESIC